MRFVSLLLVLLGLSSCNAYVGASGVKIPPDSAQQCEGQCAQIGMKLSAVAVMANNIGCVCAAKEAPVSVAPTSAPPAPPVSAPPASVAPVPPVSAPPASEAPAASLADEAASASAGMATIMMQEQARQEHQQRQTSFVR